MVAAPAGRCALVFPAPLSGKRRAVAGLTRDSYGCRIGGARQPDGDERRHQYSRHLYGPSSIRGSKEGWVDYSVAPIGLPPVWSFRQMDFIETPATKPRCVRRSAHSPFLAAPSPGE